MQELLSHQRELLAARKKDGKPYSLGYQQNRDPPSRVCFAFS